MFRTWTNALLVMVLYVTAAFVLWTVLLLLMVGIWRLAAFMVWPWSSIFIPLLVVGYPIWWAIRNPHKMK